MLIRLYVSLKKVKVNNKKKSEEKGNKVNNKVK